MLANCSQILTLLAQTKICLKVVLSYHEVLTIPLSVRPSILEYAYMYTREGTKNSYQSKS